MLSFYNNGHTLRFKIFVKEIRNLRSEPLLKLRAFCKAVNYASKLGKTYNLTVAGNIGNMSLADKWYEMMLAY